MAQPGETGAACVLLLIVEIAGESDSAINFMFDG